MEETLINSRQGWLGCGSVHVRATCECGTQLPEYIIILQTQGCFLLGYRSTQDLQTVGS